MPLKTEDTAALAPASSDATSATIAGDVMPLATPAPMTTMTAAAEYAASQPEVAGGTELATVVGEVPDETQKSPAPTVGTGPACKWQRWGSRLHGLALPIAMVPRGNSGSCRHSNLRQKLSVTAPRLPRGNCRLASQYSLSSWQARMILQRRLTR